MRRIPATKPGTLRAMAFVLAGAVLLLGFWQATIPSIVLAAGDLRPAGAKEDRIDVIGTKPGDVGPRSDGRNKSVRATCDAACEAGTGAREAFYREFTPTATPLRAACWKMVSESIQSCHNWCGWWF